MNNKSVPEVLIVDDEVEIVNVLKGSLKNADIESLTALSGNEAIEILKEHPSNIKVVISDIKMSNGTGIDLLKYIISEKGIRPEIYLITGFSSFSKEDVKAIGAKDLIMKPLDLNEIVAKVKNILDNSINSIINPRLNEDDFNEH